MVFFTKWTTLGAWYLYIVCIEGCSGGTGNKAVCSGLPRSVAFDVHLCQRNMHQSLAVGLHGENIKVVRL